jgi:hypothetical protein
MAMKRQLHSLTITDDMRRRLADKVNTLMREEQHAHKMVVRWRSKVIRSGVAADFARRYPMSTQGHLGRMLQKWTIRERNAQAKIKASNRRFWREITGDGGVSQPHTAETWLRWAPVINSRVEESNRAYTGTSCSAETPLSASTNALPTVEARVLNGPNIPDDAVGDQKSATQHSADANDLGAIRAAASNGWNVPDDAVGNLDVPVRELHLSARPSHVLKRIGIETLRELLHNEPPKILARKNCGQKSISEIERRVWEYLGGHGLMPTPRATQSWELTPPFKGDLDVAVEQLCLSRRANSVVTTAGITTVRQLANAPKAILSQSAACGARTITEIETKLREYVEKGTCCSIRIDAGTKTLCESIIAELRPREQSVMRDRYGLWDSTFKTLEGAGQTLGVTRERIRQIEGEVRKKLARRIGQAVTLFLRNKLSPCECAISSDLPEDAVLSLFADDCTKHEARLALNFLQQFQPSGGIFFYRTPDQFFPPVEAR